LHFNVCVEVNNMAGEGYGESEALAARLSEAFQRMLFQPMFQTAPSDPACVRNLISEFRDKLALLDRVIAAAEDGRTLYEPTEFAPDERRESRPQVETAASGTDDFEEIGRNQRSRVRELYLLDALSRETRAYSLQQLLTALSQKGFLDSSGAVVSQLHRLKKLGLINQPASGMYEITTEGLGHQRKLRTSFGAFTGDAR
jgi:hypothetical protein